MAAFAVPLQLPLQSRPTPAGPSRPSQGVTNAVGEKAGAESPFTEVLAGCVAANCDGEDDADGSQSDGSPTAATHISPGTERSPEVAPAAPHGDTVSDPAPAGGSEPLPPAVFHAVAPQAEPGLPVADAAITKQGNSETWVAGEDEVSSAPGSDPAAIAATAGQIVAAVYVTMPAETGSLSGVAAVAGGVPGLGEVGPAIPLHPTASTATATLTTLTASGVLTGPSPAFHSRVREGSGENSGAGASQPDQVPLLSDNDANCKETGAGNELQDSLELAAPIAREERSAIGVESPDTGAPAGPDRPLVAAEESRPTRGSITREGPIPPQIIGEWPSTRELGIAPAPAPATASDGATEAMVGRKPPRVDARPGQPAVVESGAVYPAASAKSYTALAPGASSEEGGGPLEANAVTPSFTIAPQATPPPNQYLSPLSSLDVRCKRIPTPAGLPSKDDAEGKPVPVQAAAVAASNPQVNPILPLQETSTNRPVETLRQVAASPRRTSAVVVAEVLAIGGESPRTLNSIVPVAVTRTVEIPVSPSSKQAPAEAGILASDVAPANPGPSLSPSPDVLARTLRVDTPDHDEVAFAVQVREIAAPLGGVKHLLPENLPAAEGAAPPSLPSDAETPPPAAPRQANGTVMDESDGPRARGERERNPGAPPPGPTEGPQAGAASRMTVHTKPDLLPEAQPGAERTDTTTSQTFRTNGATDPEIKPETGQRPDPVRDLKFEVTGGERRVEVRLSERGGEVKMTVRTPDAPLASTLRENLPALSARLSESGFKSDIWHPGTSGGGEWRSTGPSFGAAQDANQDANARDRQQDREPQHGSRQRQSPTSQEATPKKQKGKDFAWLISSLR